MKLVGLMLVTFLSSSAYAAQYFVDSRASGSDLGTAADPWKSMSKVSAKTFAPGDVINVARGSTYEAVLNGAPIVTLKGSGASGNPIIFQASGVGNPPLIKNTGTGESSGIWIGNWSTGSSWFIIDGFKIEGAINAGIQIFKNSNNNIIQNIEMVDCGVGVGVEGQSNIITKSNFHDFKMVRNTPTSVHPDDDYGANAIVISAPDNEFSYNTCKNLCNQSYDYGIDGGCVELFGNVSNAKIHHNYAELSCGFLENGGQGTGSYKGIANNVTVSYNVAINMYGGFWGTHRGTNWYSDFMNYHINNNTIIENGLYPKLFNPAGVEVVLPARSGPLFWVYKNSVNPLPDGALFIRNNIIATTDSLTLFQSGTTFTNEGNIIKVGMSQIETLKFANFAAKNFRLLSGSPAINASAPINNLPVGTAPLYLKDMDGNSIVGKSDVGAYEYTNGVTPVCVPAVPSIALAPASLSGLAGATLTYSAVVKNNDSAECLPRSFALSSTFAGGLSGSLSASSVNLAPGASSAAISLPVKSAVGTVAGKLAIDVKVDGVQMASAAYVVLPVVSADVVAPLTSILSPSNNSFISPKTYISVTASASDAIGVTKVEFFRNGVLKCTDTSAPYSCRIKSGARVGKVHSIQTKAYDAAGNVGLSSLFKITTK
jgi:hypothetical protein